MRKLFKNQRSVEQSSNRGWTRWKSKNNIERDQGNHLKTWCRKLVQLFSVAMSNCLLRFPFLTVDTAVSPLQAAMLKTCRYHFSRCRYLCVCVHLCSPSATAIIFIAHKPLLSAKWRKDPREWQYTLSSNCRSLRKCPCYALFKEGSARVTIHSFQLIAGQ